MRYDREHKARSRARILEAARVLFRERGLDGASIDQVMKAAGLTRGAFYAHFSSREDLVQRVLELEPGLVHDLRSAAEPGDVRRILARYLDPAEREDVAQNCAFVAHPVDVRRGDAGRREAYGTKFQELVAALEGPAARDEAVLLGILSVGGALLAAAMPDAATADEVQRVARTAVEDVLG